MRIWNIKTFHDQKLQDVLKDQCGNRNKQTDLNLSTENDVVFELTEWIFSDVSRNGFGYFRVSFVNFLKQNLVIFQKNATKYLMTVTFV